MNFFGLKTPIFLEGEDLFSFFSQHFSGRKMPEKSILIISSKVVALSQGRVVTATKAEMEQWVQKESEKYWSTASPNMYCSLKDGMLLANAGIDASNSQQGKLILLPTDLQAFANAFREKLKTKFQLHDIGVLVTDSRCTPLRTGVTGIALAWSGFFGVQDERGKKDIYGNPLAVTQNAVADNFAAAAELLMGNGNERTPFVICEQAPAIFTNALQSTGMGKFSPEEDLFSVFWKEHF